MILIYSGFKTIMVSSKRYDQTVKKLPLLFYLLIGIFLTQLGYSIITSWIVKVKKVSGMNPGPLVRLLQKYLSQRY
jgi:hypothetical protein